MALRNKIPEGAREGRNCPMKQTPEPKTERERVNAALIAEEFLDQTPATKLDILNINKRLDDISKQLKYLVGEYGYGEEE